MPKTLIALAVALGILIISYVPTLAITFGNLDGNKHPNVGALIAEVEEAGQKDILCSGTLISPTVFLTASHCTAFLESLGIDPHDVWVTFDPTFDKDTATLYRGTYHTNPEYGHDQADPHDIAVIV